MTPLLDISEAALVRHWLHGLPLAVWDGENPAATLADVRGRLLLKARRLQTGWDEGWLGRPPRADGLPLALKRLEWLLASADLVPDRQQPLAYWLADAAVAKLAPLGLVTVADWAQAYRAADGGNWWRALAGLGAAGAHAVEAQLRRHFPDILDRPAATGLPVVLQTAIVPLEVFLLPDALDGRHGANRPPRRPFIPADDDVQAIRCWLARLAPDSHTRRSYQREAERLLLWAVLVRQKPVSALDVVDMAAFRQFLADPQPRALWVGAPQKKAHAGWKPFTGPLSLRSRRHSETVLNGLFGFLVAQQYLQHNPLQALAKLKNPNQQAIGTHRAFTEAEWRLVGAFLDAQVQATTGKRQRHWRRTRLAVELAVATGLRLHELAQAQLGDIETRQRQGQTQHWLVVLGKGQKLRDVPLPLSLYQLIADTYPQLTGHGIDRPGEGHPLIPPLRGQTGRQLTPLAVHHLMKAAFTAAADSLSGSQPDTAAKLRQASAHWLRHTHGSMAVDRHIPLTMVRDNLGHSNIATTSHYVHADSDARHGAFADGFGKTGGRGEVDQAGRGVQENEG